MARRKMSKKCIKMHRENRGSWGSCIAVEWCDRNANSDDIYPYGYGHNDFYGYSINEVISILNDNGISVSHDAKKQYARGGYYAH